MTEEPSFKISQDYELIPLRSQRAYPIPVEEWSHLKKKIQQISDSANFWHTTGSVLLGVAGSALVTTFTLEIALVVWSIFFLALTCGLLSLYFGWSQRNLQRSNAQEIVTHMELIEKRYGIDEAFV